MAVFSSTQKNAECCGGFRYRPVTSAVLASKTRVTPGHVVFQFDAAPIWLGQNPLHDRFAES
jgi:hypothetical protein